MIKICKNCSTKFNKNRPEQKFCSNSCAGKYNNRGRKHSEHTKKKLSLIAKNNPSGCIKNKRNFCIVTFSNCLICNRAIRHKGSKITKLYCSMKCNPRMGGYRPGSGYSKSGYFKNIFCNSTYELAFLIFCIDHQIKIDRCKNYYEYFDPKLNLSRKYYPDFIINDDTVVEIKGKKDYTVDIKAESVKNKKFVLLSKIELKPIFEYIKKTYNVNNDNIYTLYEHYVHEELYCQNCSQKFIKKRKTSTFCSRYCAGKYRSKINHGYS